LYLVIHPQELKLLTDRLKPFAVAHDKKGDALPYRITNTYNQKLDKVFTCSPFVITVLGSGFVFGTVGFGAAQHVKKSYLVLRHPRVDRIKDENPPWVCFASPRDLKLAWEPPPPLFFCNSHARPAVTLSDILFV
jgi:hypothetical protein